jgi:hypothetical protein
MRRADKGEAWHPCAEGSWDLHASYHASGERHDKIESRIFLPRCGQEPDDSLRGVEYVTARPIAAHEPRTFGIAYQAQFFSKRLEIPVDKLRSETYRTAIEVDLAGPQDRPIKPRNAMDGEQIIQQEIFDDATPWIVVTLYDMFPNPQSQPAR